jgi:dihydrofolate reductase
MSIISLIAAVDENGGLGQNNQLLCHLPADLKHFKELTMSKPMIMGRKTFESIGKILPGRQNIILSSTIKAIPGAVVVHSLPEAFAQTNNASEVMVIGGAEIFKLTLPIAHRIYLTIIHHSFHPDVFFPPLDLKQWQCTTAHHHPKDEKNPYDLTFYLYERQV